MVNKWFEVKQTGDWWVQTLFAKHALTFGQGEFDKVAKALAMEYKREVLRTLRTEGQSAGVRWEPMAPSTRATKKGRKLLLDTYKLRRSLKVWKAEGGYYCGYKLGTSFTHRGVDVAVIAQTHEEGKTIRILVTKAMVAAYMVKLAKYNKNTKSGMGTGKMKVGSIMLIKIPARSFLASTYNAHFKDKKVAQKAVDALLDVSPLIRGLFKYIRL
jgi:hypothetical protein